MRKDMDKPLVSVIMPCFNHEKYVAEAIESVLNQTYDNIEFIALDNGSTDGSYEIMKRYEDRLAKLLHFEKNDIAKAGEALRRNCTGEYIAFMTSDDVWLPEKLEKQMRIFQEKKDVKVCFTWANLIDDDSNITSSGGNNIFCDRNRSREEWVERLFWYGNCMAYPSTVVEKESYFQVLTQLKPFYQLPDKYLWLLYLMEHNIYLIEEALVNYRWHTGGENRNMSAPDSAVSVRTYNERAMIAEYIMEQMPDELFLGAFGKYMQNSNAITHEEILCEKFFILMALAKVNPCIEQAVIDFYYRNNHYVPNVGDCLTLTLQENYHFSYLDFQEYCGNHGIGAMYLKLQYSKALENLCQKQKLELQGLHAALDSDLDREGRIALFRRTVYTGLNEDTQKAVQLLAECIGNIIFWIDQSSDEEIQENLPKMLDNVRGMADLLKKVWESFLHMDFDMDAGEWNKCLALLEKETVGAEELSDGILPVFIKVYIALQQYIAQE
ncbi:MAG TPA: glycosyltransferase [Candidatus Acetatifactor stercoripullorum]|uniref:Glycosyltransferase n=1 Tax=Candidatus Acetatifactor stercoripullorum TaxID=2838414 RepID=A0A9D1UA64_9FIRM|nr:glycosyltransferase [uncultured Acetatifactor sp.]HIW80369.1 glycosyltransferase [Candidatus Acetatifactor stercoripullorum]